MPELHYEPTTAARPVAVEHDDGVTRIVVAMPGPYAPVPRWAWELDLLSVVIGPALWLASLVVHALRRRPKPPRAVFEITAEQFSLTETSPNTGDATSLTFPRAAIAEARANRYEAGL